MDEHKKTNAVSREDYEEPQCPFCVPGSISKIPARRVVEKLDMYLSRRDYGAAERHLAYWLAEAQAGGDMQGKLTVLNEQIGLYRKIGRENEGLCAINDALALLGPLGLEGTVTAATTYLNAATGYKAFGRPNEAMILYEKARPIYEANLSPTDEKLGGLYNNTAITAAESGRYDEAKALYDMALDIMSQNAGCEAEMAITYCNLADLASVSENNEAAIEEYLTKAEELLDTPTLPRNGNYAFYCEKCAPTFGCYGFFLAEKKFSERAREIYERT